MATAVSLHELLQPQVILSVISKVRLGTGPISRWLGFAPNKFDPTNVTVSGPNTRSGPTRFVSFRLDNAVRTIMQLRAPGSSAATVPENPIGQVPLACSRFHEKVPLNYEELSNLSPVMGPNSQVDEGGQDYIGRQTLKLAMKANNAIELMAAGTIRGQWYVTLKGGDRMYPSLTQPSGVNFSVSSQIPAGNTAQLNPFGTGNIFIVPMTNPAAPFITYLQQVKANFAALTGYPMTDVWCNSIMWNYIITNNQVRQTAGTSETPFAQFEREALTGPYDNLPVNDFVCKLRGDPTVDFHLTDDILITGADIDPIIGTAPATPVATYDKIIPDTMLLFSTRPMKTWIELYLGGEYVCENPGMPGVLRKGWHNWAKYNADPSVIELMALLNAVPVLYNNLVTWPATASF